MDDDLRWSRYRNFAPAEMFTVVDVVDCTRGARVGAGAGVRAVRVRLLA